MSDRADGRRNDGSEPSRPPLRRRRWLQIAVSRRFLITAQLDALTWGVALVLATWLRFEFDWTMVAIGPVCALGFGAGTVQLILGWRQGLYQGRWRFGSFEEVAGLLVSVLATWVVVIVAATAIATRPVPVGAAVMAGPMALTAMAAMRYGWRLVLESLRRPRHDRLRRALVYGAGDAGRQLVRSMMSDPASPMIPVGVLDDDPRKANHRLGRGVAILGPGSSLAQVALDTGAEVLVIAIPSASPEFVRSVTEASEAVGLDVRVVPPRWALGDEQVSVAAVRPVSLEDLLDRPAHDLDIAAIAHYVVGARILVTGAGGSIGSELCRQLSEWAPAQLVMLDRDESALHAVALTLDHEARLDDDSVVVADIRDRDRLDEVFAGCRPQVVFHAAALKHVPLLELHPAEGVKTNVVGTGNVLAAARAVGVERFINISTDKAADPENVLGYTKCISERLTAGAGQEAAGAWVSVRFGNVLGSRGSVLTTFQHQIDAREPLTVTHEDVTRYFMTVEEAVQLVIQAGAIGENGDVLVLEMGEPVRIADVARRMAESVDPPVAVEVTGLRPGEKLNETLFAAAEVPEPTRHEAIRRVRSGVLSPEALDGLTAAAAATPDLVACLRACCRCAHVPAAPSSVP